MTKTCNHCEDTFEVGPNRANQIYCSDKCRNRNKETRRQRSPEYRAAMREYRAAHKLEFRLRMLGISQETYDALWAKQNGRCAICSKSMEGPRGCHIDHDHACCPGRRSCGNCVRGLLCEACNLGLGKFEDDTERLAAAIEYLRAR